MPERSHRGRRASGAAGESKTVVQPVDYCIAAPRSSQRERRAPEWPRDNRAARAACRRRRFLGDRQRTLRLSEKRREACLEARRVRRPGRRCGARHRAGRDDPAGREVRRPARRPSCRCCSSASSRTRPWTGSGARRCATRSCAISRSSKVARRRRRLRHPGNAGGPRRPAAVGKRRRIGFPGADLANHRGRGGAPAGPSTRGVSAALLGGTRRRRDRRLDGVLRRERQDALLAGGACLGEGLEGEGNHAHEPRRQHLPRRRSRGDGVALCAQRRRLPERERRAGRARRGGAASVRPREGDRGRPAGPRRLRGGRRHRIGCRHRSASAARAGGSASRRSCPWSCSSAVWPDPELAEAAARSRSPPRSTRRSSATICRSTPIAIRASRNS